MIVQKTPLITCVCVTKNRFHLLQSAIHCYLRQTYPNKNLVILSQGNKKSNDDIGSLLNSLNRPDIQFVEAPEFLSLGAMRNTSVELATGEIICQWDDDDLYHPDRIFTQYRELKKDNRHIASVYCDFLKFFENCNELYWCDWSGEPKLTHKFLCGSVMFYKSAFHMYRLFYPETGSQSKVEEDLNVLEKLSYKGDIAPIFAGHQYIYRFHGINTYDIDHHKLALNTQWGKKVYSNTELLEKKSLLEATFKLVDLNPPLNVCSLDGIAFSLESK
jgi:glycosyltransferase involved in cell wall biosynthesis